MSNLGLVVEESTFNPRSWEVEQLRVFKNVLDTMSETATNRFRHVYGDEALNALARDMGLPDEQINDAALRLLIDANRTIALDEGVDLPNKNDDTVAYIRGSSDNPRLWQTYTAEDTKVYEYDPANYNRRDGQGELSQELQNEIAASQNPKNPRPIVWYARYGVSNDEPDVIVSEYGFRASQLYGVAGEFTIQELIAHEMSHSIDDTNAYAQDIIGTDINISNWDNIIEARSKFNDAEFRADIIASGLLGELSGDELERFNTYLDRIFEAHEDT